MTLIEIASTHKRDYITPEDVQDAIDAGADRLSLWGDLLEILGGKGAGAEDWSLCCYIAHRLEPTKAP